MKRRVLIMSNNINESNVKKKIEADDKKAFKPFIILMIICIIGGGFVGFFSAMLADNADMSILVSYIKDGVQNGAPVIALITTMILVIYAGIVLKKVKKEYNTSLIEEGNDEQIEESERKMEYVMLFSGIDFVVVMFSLAAATEGMLVSDEIVMPLIRAAISVFDIFFAIFVITKIQKQCVNMIREVNPEKKGSVYDRNFQKEWFASCDEAEKQQIYEASWSSYKAMSKAINIMWLVCIIGGGLFEWGIMPSFVVSVLWLVQIISYSANSLKKSKKK